LNSQVPVWTTFMTSAIPSMIKSFTEMKFRLFLKPFRSSSTWVICFYSFTKNKFSKFGFNKLFDFCYLLDQIYPWYKVS
jgi:hypothetical protein